MRRALTLVLALLLGPVLSAPREQAPEAAGDVQTSPDDAPTAAAPATAASATPAPAEPARSDRLRDYIDQARAQRRAQIEQLRAESRDDSERAWQQHRESVEEQSRLHREQVERRREPQVPLGAPPPVEWSNPWYYRGW